MLLRGKGLAERVFTTGGLQRLPLSLSSSGTPTSSSSSSASGYRVSSFATAAAAARQPQQQQQQRQLFPPRSSSTPSSCAASSSLYLTGAPLQTLATAAVPSPGLLLLNSFDIPASGPKKKPKPASAFSSPSVVTAGGSYFLGGLFGGLTALTPPPSPPSLLRAARAFTAPAPAALFRGFTGGSGRGFEDQFAGGHPHHGGDYNFSGACASAAPPVGYPSAPRVVELPLSPHSRGMAEPSRRLAAAAANVSPASAANAKAAAAAASSASAAKQVMGPSTKHTTTTTGTGTGVKSTTGSSSSSSGASSSASASGAASKNDNANRDHNANNPTGGDGNKRFYHFEIRGAKAKSAIDPEKIKCMCHEVAVAAAVRSRYGSHPDADAPRVDFQDNDFCVFTQTVMRDILNAKHSKLTFWGSTHFCNTDDTVTKAIRQMTETDVGALLVMDRVSLDIDGNNIISEEELRASPESGAIKGIITERDYLRAVALGNVTWNTKVSEVMTDFEQDPHTLVSVTPDTSVLAAMEIMTEQRIRHIPCISPAAPNGSRGAKMEGMVSIGDVVKALLSEEREEVQICKDYINGMYD